MKMRKKYSKWCESSVNKAKEMAQQNERIIKIGTSVMSLPQSFGLALAGDKREASGYTV